MKKYFAHLPIYLAYAVGASYLGLLGLLILNIIIKFVTSNETIQNLAFSLTMELAACAALFILFRIAGNKNTGGSTVRIGEEIPAMILAQVLNILLNTVFRLKLPGALHVVYFVDFLNDRTITIADVWSAHRTEALLLYILFSAVGLVSCVLGYISGAKKRIAEREKLTGERSET